MGYSESYSESLAKVKNNNLPKTNYIGKVYVLLYSLCGLGCFKCPYFIDIRMPNLELFISRSHSVTICLHK